ncbi:uncharacterized protein LOC143596571 [Bidens hawaiensis]|uniref:uncharacterized protein LOC143596571 n=1 Tax=Bidens hawaiensis TaxID=980011 RepID=UPI0040492C0E
MAGDKPESSKTDNNPDPNSPLYIHPSDYPKQLHVNETLNDHNYSDWSQEMMNFLFAKNKVGFVDGTLKKPEKTATDYMPWMRCDAMIKGWLTTAMEKEIRSSVKFAGIAFEIWSDLLERFGKESAPKAYELKHALTTTQQFGASVSAYYTKLRSLWDEIESVIPMPRCTCDGCNCDIGKKLNEAKEKERLYEFLMGLDNEFGVIKTQILATKPIPTLSNAYHLVAEDERQRAISLEKKPVTEAAAFKVVYPQRRESKINNRDKTITKEKVVTKEKRTDVVDHYTFCGKDGHNKEGCFKRIGYPEWWPGNKAKRDGTKAVYVETNASPIHGLSKEQYQLFINTFGGDKNIQKNQTPRMANFAGKGTGTMTG